MILKSFESPCPMNIHPRSTKSRSFLYTSFRGVRVYRDSRGSKSPTGGIKQLTKLNLTHLTLYSRKFCQVIDNQFASVNVVVNKGDSLFRARTPQDGNPSQAESWRTYNLGRAIGSNLCLFLRKISITVASAAVTRQFTCCIKTNSASIATRVPGRGSSSEMSGSCLIRFSSRFLR